MSKDDRLTLRGKISQVYGCGALNWDLFYEVPSLAELRRLALVDFEISSGGEVVLSREKLLSFMEILDRIGKRVFACGGGSAANTIYALGRLGFHTAFIGISGLDEFGDSVVSELTQAQVDLNLVERVAETSIALIVLDRAKDRFITVSPGSGEGFFSSPDFLTKVKKRLPEGGFLLHLTSLASPEGERFQREILREIKKDPSREVYLSFDPGEIYAKRGKDFLFEYLKRVDLLFMTQEELRASGLRIEEIFDFGVIAIFLKEGKEGAQVITPADTYKVKAVKPERMVDNTGAGDYFNAGVLASLVQGGDLKESLQMGILLASLSLRNYGRASLPSDEELCLKYKELYKPGKIY